MAIVPYGLKQSAPPKSNDFTWPKLEARRLFRRGCRWLLFTVMLASSVRAQPPVTIAWDANPEPDVAGYLVFLGTVSGNLPTIEDVGDATSYHATGLQPSTTYYFAVQAYNTAGLTSERSAEVSFTTANSSVILDIWAKAGGLSDSSAKVDATPFQDGIPNLLKFAFNLNPSGPDARILPTGTGKAGLPNISLDQSGPQPLFRMEYLRRKKSGLVYTPEVSSDLVTFSPIGGTIAITDIDAEWERVNTEIPCDPSTTPRLFGRVNVTLPSPTSPARTPLETFNFWAGANGLLDSAAAANATPFNDGVPNLLKFAFNLDPSGPDTRVLDMGAGKAGLPNAALDRSGPTPLFRIEFLRRRNSGLVYTPKTTTDLVNFSVLTGTTYISTVDGAWERVVVEKVCDPATTPRLFGVVEVTIP